MLSWGASQAASTPVAEPPVPFGRVVFRAARIAGLKSLGITMIACRHRDPVPRRFAVQFFDPSGRLASTFGNIPASPPTPAGKKVVFVTDGMPFEGDDVLNLRLGHVPRGTARVILHRFSSPMNSVAVIVIRPSVPPGGPLHTSGDLTYQRPI